MTTTTTGVPVQVTIQEVVHAQYKEGVLQNTYSVFGQISLAVSTSDSSVTGAGIVGNKQHSIRFKINEAEKLMSIVLNPTYISVDASGVYTCVLPYEPPPPQLSAALPEPDGSKDKSSGSEFGTSIIVLKYKVRTEFAPEPIRISAAWQDDTSKRLLSLVFQYVINPNLPREIEDVGVLVSFTSGSISRVQMKPDGLWGDQQQKLLWTIPSIRPRSSLERLMARFEVSNSPAVPAPVTVKFSCRDFLLSGVSISLEPASPYSITSFKRSLLSGKFEAY